MSTTEELLARLINLENEAVQATQRQGSAEQALAAAKHRIQQLSSGDGATSTSAGVIDTRTLGKPKTFNGQPAEWTTWQFTFRALRVRRTQEGKKRKEGKMEKGKEGKKKERRKEGKKEKRNNKQGKTNEEQEKKEKKEERKESKKLLEKNKIFDCKKKNVKRWSLLPLLGGAASRPLSSVAKLLSRPPQFAWCRFPSSPKDVYTFPS